MKEVQIDLKHCYGIKSLQYRFDFSSGQTYAIYAPNGVMKTSLAKTFKDVVENKSTSDVVFRDRKTTRVIKNADGNDIKGENILVLEPYSTKFSSSARTSTLLVNESLRFKYAEIVSELDRSKNEFFSSLKKISGYKGDWESEIVSVFSEQEEEVLETLTKLRDSVNSCVDFSYSDLKYDVLFSDKSKQFLEDDDSAELFKDYIERYDELISKSRYFKKGVFNYYNANSVASSLSKNGFFKAKHSLTLNADEPLEVSNESDLEALVNEEREKIAGDSKLKQELEKIETRLNRNQNLREFRDYLLNKVEILPQLANVENFKRQIIISYLNVLEDQYSSLLSKYSIAQKQKSAIEKEAAKQRTQWQEVIEIFNERFFVPFKLEARNHTFVVLGREPVLDLRFIFVGGDEEKEVPREELMGLLSKGELKALYLLDIIFEVEVRKKEERSTLFVFDDIADSFDYKNKYAIIQYMQEIVEIPFFKQIILTHNFDFFRTIESRGVVKYKNCLMSFRTDEELFLESAKGLRNVFVRDWKRKFHSTNMIMIASIPFIRNILEYTAGVDDPRYLKLTSLLHWKLETKSIKRKELCSIFNEVFNFVDSVGREEGTILETIFSCVSECETAPEGINFENKIVLSIAIRLMAERFMLKKIPDDDFLSSIKSNQTQKLFDQFREEFPTESDSISTLQKVVLMTPENIHLNAFMYEPIIDMSDEHLRKLWGEVKKLSS